MPNSPQAQLPEARPLGQAMRESAEVALGKYGCRIIADTNEQFGTNGRIWVAITFITATVFTKCDFGSNPPEGQIAGVTFPAGLTIYGEFKSIKLASGSLIAYYGKPSSHA